MVLASIKVQFVSLSLLLFHCGILSGQKVTVTGNITDSLNVPLSFANIIADPSEYGSSITFAISDDNGRYTLSIEKGKRYQLTFSYLGFETETLIIKASQDTVKNMVLSLGSNYLEEVTVTYKLPITIKEDTIIYRTDSFATGKERKLRDILKKLPAVEVDDTGNVFVQGKKITKVLVENKEFFTGDSKLAVNNIPADAVDKIEILDQYNEIGFLKGLEDSNDVVMNIKLKQNKKKFVFGDIDAGLGHKERYTLNPSMYYYSPKTTVNTIIDINNLGSKSFTVTDYIEFEGGSNQLINDSKSYFSLLNDDFAQFLSNKDFSSSRNHFGAINLTKNINQKVELSSYAILSNIKNETKIEAQNEYILNDNQVELRSTTGKHNNQFGVGKLKLKLKPNINTDITFDSYIKASRSSVQNIMYTSSKESSNTINTNINSQNISLKQDIQLHKKLSKNHTISTIINYNYLNTSPTTNWLTDKTILSDLLPLVQNKNYNLFKVKNTRSHSIDFVLKHYWILNRYNHIYFTLDTQFAIDELVTSEYQSLNDGNRNNFSSAGFGNNANFKLNDISFGVQYKVQKGIVTFKPGLTYHNYGWKVSQSIEKFSKNKNLILPEVTVDLKISTTKKLNFKYNIKSRFPNIANFANRFTLLTFNSIYKGNERLENELYHNFKLNFYRFSLYKNLYYNFSINYRSKRNNIKNETFIQGIDYISTPVISDFEDRILGLSGGLNKGIGKYKFSLTGDFSLSNYEKPINGQIIANTSKKYSYKAGVKTRYNNFPNLGLYYTNTISEYQISTISKFTINIFTASIKYNILDNITFKADYCYERYNSKSFNNSSSFKIANVSLYYQKDNSSRGYEIVGSNIFKVAFKQRNSFSSILISDVKTYILPRTITLKISYKL